MHHRHETGGIHVRVATLTGYAIDGSQWSQHSNGSYRCQIQILHMHHILQQSGEHNEEVQTIPRVSQVRVLAAHAHCHHFDGHLQCEEGEDNVVEDLCGGRE